MSRPPAGLQAEEDAAAYWALLEAWQAPSSDAQQACWSAIVQRASEHVLPSVAKVLPVVLGAHQYSARLQAVRQLTSQLHPEAPVSGGQGQQRGQAGTPERACCPPRQPRLALRLSHLMVLPMHACTAGLGALQGCCFVDLDGTVVRQPDQLGPALEALASQRQAAAAPHAAAPLFEFDHVYNPGSKGRPGGRAGAGRCRPCLPVHALIAIALSTRRL